MDELLYRGFYVSVSFLCRSIYLLYFFPHFVTSLHTVFQMQPNTIIVSVDLKNISVYTDKNYGWHVNIAAVLCRSYRLLVTIQ